MEKDKYKVLKCNGDYGRNYSVKEENGYTVAYKMIENVHSHKAEHDEAYELLRMVLKDYYEVDFNSLVIAKGEHGKPYFENLDIHFNISHCKGMVACVISKELEVGVDVEVVRTYRENVLRRVFTEPEKRAFDKSEDKDTFFFKIWTFKESIIKCSGTGLSRDIREIDYFDEELRWHQYEVLCENGKYILTVALNSED